MQPSRVDAEPSSRRKRAEVPPSRHIAAMPPCHQADMPPRRLNPPVHFDQIWESTKNKNTNISTILIRTDAPNGLKIQAAPCRHTFYAGPLFLGFANANRPLAYRHKTQKTNLASPNPFQTVEKRRHTTKQQGLTCDELRSATVETIGRVWNSFTS